MKITHNTLSARALTRVWLQTIDPKAPLRAIWIATAKPSAGISASSIGGDTLCA